MPLRYQAWQIDPAFRAAVVKVFPFVVFYWLDEPAPHRRDRGGGTAGQRAHADPRPKSPIFSSR
jgi:hypothetical protein